jgi:purine-binding chemotaxis protein CheW
MTGVFVRVRAAGEHYALPVEKVVEVGRLGDVTPVPGAPPAVLGIRNLRGQIMPVVDLATLFGLASDTARESIVVTEDGDQRVGLSVDSVVDVGILPPPTESSDAHHLSGAMLVDGTLVGVIDLDAALGAVNGAQAR